MKKKYGYIPDLGDFRDYPYVAPTGLTLPAKVDNFNTSIPIWDQGQLGSCTSFGTPRALLNTLLKEGHSYFEPSHLQVYYDGRALEGTIKQDSGCQIRDIVKGLVDTGAGDNKLWPYIINKFKTKPPVKVYTSAKANKALTYFRVDNTKLSDLKACLAEGYTMSIGITVYTEFESSLVAQTGHVPIPGKGSKPLGGHCICLEGYDGANFICTNSWSDTWGLKGRFTIPYAYLTNPNLATDFWVFKTVS